MDNEKAIEKFVQKANKFLLIHILFFVGLFIYGFAIVMFFGGGMPDIFEYSLYIWVAISLGMEVVIRVVIMKCPICGKDIRANTKLTFFLPAKCKHCDAIFRNEHTITNK